MKRRTFLKSMTMGVLAARFSLANPFEPVPGESGTVYGFKSLITKLSNQVACHDGKRFLKSFYAEPVPFCRWIYKFRADFLPWDHAMNGLTIINKQGEEEVRTFKLYRKVDRFHV